MFYLLASIVGASSLIIILKLFQLKGVNNVIGITINYVVGAVFAFVFAKPVPADYIISAGWFDWSLFIGAMFMLSFMVYAASAQHSGVAVTAISGRAAMAIPVIFAFVKLGEQPTFMRIAMLVLLMASLPMIMYREKTPGQSSAPKARWLALLPLVVFLWNGFNDTMVQYAQRVYIAPDPSDNPIFMGTMFAAGAVTGIIYYLIVFRKKYPLPTGRDLLWGSILGFANWVCMIGVLYALRDMAGSVFFPLYYTGAIVCSTIVGVWAFKEKLSVMNYVGIVVAICAIVTLAMQ